MKKIISNIRERIKGIQPNHKMKDGLFCCYVCGRQFDEFLPYREGWQSVSPFIQELQVIGSDVQNFSCPICRCHDRERHLVMYFDHLGLWEKLEGKNVLHFAPEKKFSALIEQRRLNSYVKADLCPSSSDIQVVDVTNMSFDNEAFDVVICNHVLEHVTDDDKAISELFRVTSLGGFVILQTPYSPILNNSFFDSSINNDELRKRFYGQEDHVRVYGQDLFEKIRHAGFNLEIKTHKDVLPDINSAHFGVNVRESLILGVKPEASQFKLGHVYNTIIESYFAEREIRKLHLGCGENILNSWLNSDFSPHFDEILHLDVTDTFPFSNDTIDYIFSEHMIEHISYLNGLTMLSECYRVLRNNGKIRISTPDLQFLVDLYKDDKSQLQREYIDWASDAFIKSAPYSDAIFVINNFVRDWGHLFIYDEKTLRASMEKVGFTEIIRCDLNESKHEPLRNLENEKRMPEGFLMLESFTLEGTKVASS